MLYSFGTNKTLSVVQEGTDVCLM